MWILFWSLIILVGMIAWKYHIYNKSGYGYSSGNGFIRTIINKGNYGEFLTYRYLEKLKGDNQIMTNLYLPKNDGTTTEVDLIMISETGVYVFESKNYGGWIYGDEKNKNWTQTFGKGKKFKFFNPIWQNAGHITALKENLRMDDEKNFKSYIIFSERCTLKKVKVRSDEIKLMNRDDLPRTIRKDMEKSKKVFSKKEIDNIYSELLRFTHADDEVKKEHIDNIISKKS